MTTIAAGTISTTADAMRVEELTLARRFVWMSWIASAGFLALLPLIPGDPALERVAAIAVIACAVIGVLVFQFLRPDRYRPELILLVSAVGLIPTGFAVVLAGTFSIAVLFLTLAVYGFGRVEYTPAAYGIFLLLSQSHVAMSLLICFDVVPDPGMYSIAGNDAVNQIVAVVVSQGVILSVFILARATRKASVASIEGLRRATRLASQRQAMLNELRHDLEHALGIGGPGRHTERELGGYKLGFVIGRGAMSEVYEAVHVETDELAAVKLLHRDLMAEADHVSRFLREVESTRKLASEHVVRILGASDPDDPIPYLVMERLSGETLAELLRERERLDADEIADLVTHVSSALTAAAGQGIVHRDVKPQNLFFAAQGERRVWKVLDFGVAALAASAGTLTQGQVVGTPAYMSPEQAQGAPVDSRADVYGLAAVCYRCLTGRSPFSARDTPALLYKVVHEMPTDPRALGTVSDQVASVLAIGMAKSTLDRFETAEQLATAMTRALKGKISRDLAERASSLLSKHPWKRPIVP